MTLAKFIIQELQQSKSYHMVAMIVLISIMLMILFGPKIDQDPVTNFAIWFTLGIVPTITNTLGGMYIRYKNFQNIIVSHIIVFTVTFLCLAVLICILTPMTFSVLTDAIIIYVIIVIAAFIIHQQILKIENLISIEKNYCPNILKSIPLPKRGELWALQANDHYVNIITSKGNHMVYSSLSDAIAQTTPVNGVRIHRSFWVAENSLKDIVRKNNRYVCILKNDMEVPVSRQGMAHIKNLGWIK